ncbi:MAG: hypothetical protein AABX90_02315 [Nanoarchaeota archaeon]
MTQFPSRTITPNDFGSKYLERLRFIRDHYTKFLGLNPTAHQEEIQVAYIATNNRRCSYDRCRLSKNSAGLLQISTDNGKVTSVSFPIHQECLEAICVDPRLGSLN